MKMKKWEAVAFQEFSQWFIMDVDDDREWIFTDMTLGTFMQPLKDTKEYWIFFVEMIYKLYKCDMIEFPDDYTVEFMENEETLNILVIRGRILKKLI